MSAAPGRAARLQRLATVQKKRREIAEWRVSELSRLRHHIETEIAAIIESLGSQSLLSGLFLDQKVLTLRRKDAELAANALALKAAGDALLACLRSEKQLCRMLSAARYDKQRADEAGELSLTLEAFLVRPGASLE